MTDKFDKTTLTKNINSDYQTETKALQIINLYELQCNNLLNDVSNRFGRIIDFEKYKNKWV